MLQNYNGVSLRLKKLPLLNYLYLKLIVCNPKTKYFVLLNGNTDFDEAFTGRIETYKEEVTRDVFFFSKRNFQ